MRVRLPRRRWLATLALALGALAVLAVVLVDSGAPRRASAATGVPAGDTTASVTRRTLTEGATVDGTLGYGSKLELYDRLGGTFTWLPAVGAVVGRGGTLFRVNEQPVVLMYGSVPAYRTLKQGVGDGPDVRELNENLIDLGFDPYGAIADDEAFGAATAAAVRRWQKAEGLAESGEVELGRIVFAPSARRVTEVHVSLGQDPPGEEPAATTPAATTPAPTTPTSTPTSTGPSSTTPSSTTPASSAPASTAPAAKTPAAKTPPSSKSPSRKPHEPASHGKPPSEGHAPSKPAAQGDESKKPSAAEAPAKEAAGKPNGGQNAGAGEAVLATTSTQQLAQLTVKAEQQQLAHVGEAVPVSLPGGDVVHGRISEVGTVASEPKASAGGEKGGQGSESETATISVTVALDHPVARLDQAPVSVELVKSIQRHVLTVPATALIATAGGGYAVEALEGARRVVLAVTPGMFAGGYVQVEGAGLHEGLRVVESQ